MTLCLRLASSAIACTIVLTSASMSGETLPAIEIEGLITVDGVPATRDIGVTVRSKGSSLLKLKAPLDANGVYRAKVAAARESDEICFSFERTRPLNYVERCGTFTPGSQRFDIDLAPGVIAVDVAPVKRAAPGELALLVVGTPGSVVNRTFRLAEGFRGEYFGNGFKQYDVRVTTMNGDKTLSSSTVILSAEHPVSDVKLTVATRR